MISKRQINDGNELMNFFCKDAVEGNIDNKEYCKFIVDYENKGIYTGIYTSYEDVDILYNDLLNPNIKWNVTFITYSEILLFENGEHYIVFDGIEYNEVKDFFEVNK